MQNIAVFERDKDIAELIEFILVRADYKVVICRDTEELCAVLKTADTAIIDTYYLNSHVIEYLVDLCATERGPRLICATGVPASASSLIRSRRSRLLMKPFTEDELLGLLSSAALGH